jgi:hypothetical protein
MPPFVDNDPSKDWVQPEWLKPGPQEGMLSYNSRKEAVREMERRQATDKIENALEQLQKLAKLYPAMQSKLEPALRYDGDKSRVDLIPPEFILALGQHFGQGAKKYAERNWEKGMSWSRCYSSAMRHMLAFWSGEANDPETGSPHVICAAWNMCALHWYGLYRTNLDDRAVTVSDREADVAAESHGS